MYNSIECWKKTTDSSASWVIFQYGTCVSVDRAESDPTGVALGILFASSMNRSEIEIGLYGRNKRDQDTKNPEIIYVHQP